MGCLDCLRSVHGLKMRSSGIAAVGGITEGVKGAADGERVEGDFGGGMLGLAKVEKAARRNAELSARAAQLSAEAQAWQARARAQEATAAALQERLQQAIMRGGGGEEREEEEDAESAYIDPDRVVETSGPSCKVCRRRVVVLPCRHLCLCSECGAVAQACPLCLSFRGWE